MFSSLETMTTLQEQLSAKQREIDALKLSFDEYVSSSKELELELEVSLEDVLSQFTCIRIVL